MKRSTLAFLAGLVVGAPGCCGHGLQPQMPNQKPLIAASTGISEPLVAPSQRPTPVNVSYDEHSLLINGRRVMIFSGEFHPWRLPVPSLWIDVLQKIKALGFNCVSFYVNWALVEGRPGTFASEGVFDIKPLLDAAASVGLYLIARPGPYINAEVSFGGFPGWLQRLDGLLRTSSEDYLNATELYIASIGRIIADAQITRGGPVILYQPENEYSWGNPLLFPDGNYMQYVEDQARRAGIEVPFISNDAAPFGHNTPGGGLGAVDIYGHDSYPLGFNCANPGSWPSLALPVQFPALHRLQSPTTPFSLVEFQGGSFDPWGGPGFESCAAWLDHEFVRVFYKNNIAAGVSIFNVYMIFGGTNWGNIGHPSGYSSYDYGAAILEDRTITREKYSELKLLANFIQVSPGYLTSIPGPKTVGSYSSNRDITITRLEGNETGADFYVLRHTNYAEVSATNYTLRLPMFNNTDLLGKRGPPFNCPNDVVLTGTLTLAGRDSKIVVTNYQVHRHTILYSTAEVFTWQRLGDTTVLIVYSGGPVERNEMVIATSATPQYLGGSRDHVNITDVCGGQNLSFTTIPGQEFVVRLGDLFVYMMDRNEAHKYWVTSATSSSWPIIVKGPYLVRSAVLDVDGILNIQADFNKSTDVAIMSYPHPKVVIINGRKLDIQLDDTRYISTHVEVPPIHLELPTLSGLDWNHIDSLPELDSGYDDASWPVANLKGAVNSVASDRISLAGSRYGFHAGILLFRGHFIAPASNTWLRVKARGGLAFAYSVWLNGSLVHSFDGKSTVATDSAEIDLSSGPAGLQEGAPYVLTVVLDNMGYDENPIVGYDQGKTTRGLLDYELRYGRWRWWSSRDITWKITGNLGGEKYQDRVRGPLNEGGLFVERHGLHQPEPPLYSSPRFSFSSLSPLEGTSKAGVSFYTANMDLDLPSEEWDVPLAFVFESDTNGTSPESRTSGFRAQLWVNGWNFGRYISHVGPQSRFPVPEGILNYKGENWIGLAVWATRQEGARLVGFELQAGAPVWTGREPVELVQSPVWSTRDRAY